MKELPVAIADVFSILGMEPDNKLTSSWKSFYIFLRTKLSTMLLNIANHLEIVFILSRYWAVCFRGYKSKGQIHLPCFWMWGKLVMKSRLGSKFLLLMMVNDLWSISEICGIITTERETGFGNSRKPWFAGIKESVQPEICQNKDKALVSSYKI